MTQTTVLMEIYKVHQIIALTMVRLIQRNLHLEYLQYYDKSKVDLIKLENTVFIFLYLFFNNIVCLFQQWLLASTT
jgi:hypothetical protein